MDDTEDDGTFYNDERSSCIGELDALNKMITLQSIRRLEYHLPQIVTEQLIADMRQRRDQPKEQGQGFSLLGRGSMTLEVPIIPSSTSNTTQGEAATPVRPTASNLRVSVNDGSAKSLGGMSDLLNTLTSLDELLGKFWGVLF